MAAGWMQHLAGDRVEVFSGGSDPASEVNPAAVEAMSEIGIDISTEFPKPWTDEVLRAADVIVTMGCGDACPVFPGKPVTAHWSFADPTRFEGSDQENYNQFLQTAFRVKRRVELFTSLPMEKLGHLLTESARDPASKQKK
jgi:protein-tyrosine-phosphatase